MKSLWFAARGLFTDMASTLLFVALNLLSGNLMLAIAAGIALALVQIGWHLARRAKITALQWVSLVLVIASGATALWSHDPRFVMAQPSLVYVAVGAAMLQRNWMARYMPPVALSVMPDLVVSFGTVWSGLMFLSAVVNLGLALRLDTAHWGAALSIYAIASKVSLFFLQYGVMRTIGRSRMRDRALAHI